MARELDPDANYCAMRWNYNARTMDSLRAALVVVINPLTGATVLCHPADWGPNINTGRIIDLSPGALATLGATTDDKVIVVIVWQGTI